MRSAEALGESGAGAERPARRGSRVLDLTRLLPGPFASLVLGDLGARVDKIEDTGPGDYLRHAPHRRRYVGDVSRAEPRQAQRVPRPEEGARARGAAASWPRATTCSSSSSGRACSTGSAWATRRLLAHEPAARRVRAHRVRAGRAARAARGPRHQLPRAGGRARNAGARRAVRRSCPGSSWRTSASGLWSVIGIMAALHERATTGKGRVVDVSMVEASMGFALAGFGTALRRAGAGARRRAAHRRARALRDVRHEATGGASSARRARAEVLERVLRGRGAQGRHERSHARSAPGGAQGGAARRSSRRARAPSGRHSDAQHDCCLEPVLEPGEIRDDEHLRARERVLRDGLAVGPHRSSCATPLTVRGATHAPPPRRGEHTDAILREAGIDDATIAAMRAEGAAE